MFYLFQYFSDILAISDFLAILGVLTSTFLSSARLLWINKHFLSSAKLLLFKINTFWAVLSFSCSISTFWAVSSAKLSWMLSWMRLNPLMRLISVRLCALLQRLLYCMRLNPLYAPYISTLVCALCARVCLLDAFSPKLKLSTSISELQALSEEC